MGEARLAIRVLRTLTVGAELITTPPWEHGHSKVQTRSIEANSCGLVLIVAVCARCEGDGVSTFFGAGVLPMREHWPGRLK